MEQIQNSNYKDCIFAIDQKNCGCVGKRYPNLKAAIIEGHYSPWNHKRMKAAFSFGNGTLKDFNRYCKDNFITVIGPERFFEIVDKLKDKEIHYQFIEDIIHNYR